MHILRRSTEDCGGLQDHALDLPLYLTSLPLSSTTTSPLPRVTPSTATIAAATDAVNPQSTPETQHPILARLNDIDADGLF